MPNVIVSTSITSENLISNTNVTSNISATTTLSTNSNPVKQQATLKVELPKFNNSKNISLEQQAKESSFNFAKSVDEIKKEDQSSSQIDPLVSKLSSSTITTKPSPTASPIATPQTTIVQTGTEQKSNINIPNISERIHNSTTALKLKTGKFHLDDNYQVGYQATTAPPTVISTPATTITSSLSSSLNNELKLSQAQLSIPTSVVVNSTISQNLPIVTQPLLVSNANMNLPITSSIPSPFKQTPITTAPQFILSQSPYSTSTGQLPSQDFNLFNQNFLFQQMQQNPAQFMNLAGNPYLHPDALRNLPLGASLQSRYSGLIINPATGLPITTDKELEDSKMQLKQQDSMPPPLSSIRLPTPHNTSMAANYPLIRTPIPPHLISPHEQQNSPVIQQQQQQQQRFTESPFNNRSALMSPNLKMDIKPNININTGILQPPQRPQSQYNLPTMNSPSPVPVSMLQQQSNTPNAALSPSLGYRKDLQSPIVNPVEHQQAAMHPRKLHQKYAAQQAAKESNLLNTNLLPPYQLPGHLLNNSLLSNNPAYQQQQLAALSMQQQLNSAVQIQSPQPQLIPSQSIQQQQQQQQQIVDQSSGDHLMQKYPKLWQGKFNKFSIIIYTFFIKLYFLFQKRSIIVEKRSSSRTDALCWW